MTKLKYNIKVKCIDGSLGKEAESVIYDKPGTFSIGRGTFEKLQEKKCSRKQISIIINDDNTFYISSNGVNPSYLKKNDEEYFVQMNRDQNYILNNKDCFSLLFEMFTFMVIFESNENGSNNNSNNNIIDNGNTIGNKRRLEQEQIDDKPKKLCPYGSSCFRKNPAHFEEFDHLDNINKQQHKNDDNNNDIQQKKNINNEDSKQSQNIQTVSKQQESKQQELKQQELKQQQPKQQQQQNQQQNQQQKQQQPLQQQPQHQNDQDNSNIAKIIGPKYKKKKLTDGFFKERSLAFPFISTTTFEYNVEKATTIAAKAISEYLSFHEQDGDDIKLKMMVEKSIYSDQLIENFKKLFNNKWDKRFEIIKIDNSNSLEQFNFNCKFFATETTWRLKKTPQNKVLYDQLLDLDFEKQTKNRYPNPGKIGKAHPVPINNSGCILKKEYGVDTVILVLGPNMSEKKPDQFKDYKDADPILLETYHSLFSALDNF